MWCSSARRAPDFVTARLGLLQQLCGLDQQAALERFLHVHHCLAIGDDTISQKVAELQRMLAGSRWTAGQLVASQPTLLGEPRLASSNNASRLSCMSDCIAACNAMPFHCPSSAPLLTACRSAAGNSFAGSSVKTLSKRYLALRKAALSHPAWGEQWGRYKAATIGALVKTSEARLERLELLIERGWQGSYSMSYVVKMTNARWHQALHKLELQEGARGVQQPQRSQVRRRQ
jgi:hypothetical protein